MCCHPLFGSDFGRGIGLPVVIAMLTLYTACSAWPGAPVDTVVAQAFDKKLLVSELEAALPPGLEVSDSLLFVNAYIDKWLKENVVLYTAEQNLPVDLQIDKLVKSYRASLIMHQYEKFVVESLLDTVISLDELEAYYDEYKSQYHLESTIVRCHLIKVPSKTPDRVLKRFEELWKSNKAQSQADLIGLSNSYAERFYLSDSLWYKLDLISQEMPEGSVNLSAIRNNRVFHLINDDYNYFLRLLEIKDRKEIAPLAFVQEQAAKVILHQRKVALLESWKDDLFRKAQTDNQIKLLAP